MWTGLEKAAVYGIGLAQSVALARLLRPEDFGLAAMLGVFLNIGETLAESGLGTALVVLGKPGKEVERAALKWNLGIAAGLYALLCAGSWPISRFYGEPVLVPLLCVMALGLLAHAASVVALARLTREMAFGRLAWVHACSTLCAGGVAVLCAWRGGGVWSIAALTLVMACVRTALAWWFAGPKGEDGAASGARAACAFRPTLRLGLAFMASGLVWNVYVNLSQLIIGKLYSPAAVGLFVRGQRWATMPGEVVNESVARVALPTLYYSENDLKEMAILSADLNAYESEMFAKFVVGEADIETQWDAFQKDLTSMGIQDCIDIYQEAYDTYMASKA